MTKEHPQAHILRAIADGHTEFDFRYVNMIGCKWMAADAKTVLSQLNNPDYEFRIRPDTITVNGVEVPKSVKFTGNGDHGITISTAHMGRLNLLYATEADARAVFDALIKPFKE